MGLGFTQGGCWGVEQDLGFAQGAFVLLRRGLSLCMGVEVVHGRLQRVLQQV